jgi:hypothetical protein
MFRGVYGLYSLQNGIKEKNQKEEIERMLATFFIKNYHYSVDLPKMIPIPVTSWTLCMGHFLISNTGPLGLNSAPERQRA